MMPTPLPRLSALLLALALPALGCSKDEAKTEAKSEEKNPFASVSQDWSAAALSEKITGTTDGIAFTLSLPASLKREEKEPHGSFPGYVTWQGPHPFHDPSFTVKSDIFPPEDLEAATRRAGIPAEPTKVVGSGALEGGGFYVSIVAESNKFLQVQAWQTSGEDKVLRFSTSVRHSEGIANTDALRSWMESVAKTFRVTAVAP